MDQPGPTPLLPGPSGPDPRVDWEELLLAHYDRLLRYIQRQLPREFRPLCEPEDILQETLARAVRNIGQFHPSGDDAFYRWLATIARNTIIDFALAQKRVKRGGGRVRLGPRPGGSTSPSGAWSYDLLLDEVAVTSSTPTRSAARHEAVAALHVALAQLHDDMRQAVTLRYIEGQSVAHTAKAMDRTERAIHMLCHRALRTMRVSMGRASSYLSSTG